LAGSGTGLLNPGSYVTAISPSKKYLREKKRGGGEGEGEEGRRGRGRGEEREGRREGGEGRESTNQQLAETSA
jgi:hypothetical protein